MNAEQRLTAEEGEVLVAPQEISELLSRLTGQTVGGENPKEARSLAALAAETGVPVSRLQVLLNEMRGTKPPKAAALWLLPVLAVVLGWAGYRAIHLDPTPPQNVVAVEPQTKPIAVPTQTADHSGLQLVTGESFGVIDTSIRWATGFEPKTSLPPGLVETVSIADVKWGAGDVHAGSIRAPLSKAQLKLFEDTLFEMASFARSEAVRRRLFVMPEGMPEASTMNISIGLRTGDSSGADMTVVSGASTMTPADEQALRKAVRASANRLAVSLTDIARNRYDGP